MQTLNVALGERSYPIHIGAGLLARTELIADRLPKKKVAIITNTTVAPLYLAPLARALEARGVEVVPITLPDGEQHKNWETLNRIFDVLLERRCERGTTLIALGGGVVGDLAGFAAAAFLRGVPFIQVPTTLLAQVDSAVGGKTAINHPLGKNMIGAFYQPQAVIADTDTLATLPPRAPDLGLERYLDLMGHDKKVEGGRIRFVLLKRIGEAFVSADVPRSALADVLGATRAHA